MTTSYPDELSDILDEKTRVCKKLFVATLLLKKALEKEEMDEVDLLLGCRAELMGIIDRLDRRSARHRDAGSCAPDPATAYRRSKISEDLRVSLKRIAPVNQECNILVAGRLEEARKELTIIRQKEKAYHGYADHRQGMPKFLSIKT